MKASERLKEAEDDVKMIEEKIRHLRSDISRLETFYRNTGRFSLDSEKFIVNNLVHYQVVN